MQSWHWDEIDVALVTGDAYVDHPSFGAAMIGRVLENEGCKTGIIAMPDWRNVESMKALGKPRLFFGVTSGNVDSMLMRQTALRKARSDDPFVPGGKAGSRPERALIVYCNLIRSAYKDVPIVIGGIEASMRRLSHFDFWTNKVRRSILLDARANILVYGMGEAPVCEIAKRIENGQALSGIPGTVVVETSAPPNAIMLPSQEETIESRNAFLECYKLLFAQQDRVVAQPAAKRFLVQYPIAHSDEDSAKLDQYYALPFTRKPHSSYREAIPALDMIGNSIACHRGCVSGCAFCSLTLHQGKRVISRSRNSVLQEAKKVAAQPGFKGHITDIGGPTANMYGLNCKQNWKCKKNACTFPNLCPNLILDTQKWVGLLNDAAKIPGVKHVTVGSGIRYDLFMRDPQGKKLLGNLAAHHVSGQLKIAPEHTSPGVLKAMHKTSLFDLREFTKHFREATKQAKKEQYIIPYLMSAHPGCTPADMESMRKEMLSIFGFVPVQSQTFIPLPMTLSSVIYHTGIDPITGESFAVTQNDGDRGRQQQVISPRKGQGRQAGGRKGK